MKLWKTVMNNNFMHRASILQFIVRNQLLHLPIDFQSAGQRSWERLA